MKILIPYQSSPIGGASSFVSEFSEKLIEDGHLVVSNYKDDYDILLVISDCPLKYIFDAKFRRKKIVQRLNGVYHRASSAGVWYPLFNLKMKIIYHWFADYIVFQSNFSKNSCEIFLGKLKRPWSIIYNGARRVKNISKSNNVKIKLLTFAKFRRKDQILPIIKAVNLLSPDDYRLDIYGGLTENIAKEVSPANFPNIALKGEKRHRDLVKIINQYDIFLFSDQSACPNSVLEALMSGLPVVAFDRGGLCELIINNISGEIVPISNHDQYNNSYPFLARDYRAFSEAIVTVAGKLADYKRRARRCALESFSLDTMTRKYLSIFQSIMSGGK